MSTALYIIIHKEYSHIPVESIKSYSANIKAMIYRNCLVLFPIYPIRFSNLTGFNRSFLPVEMGEFLQKAPFENLQKRVKQQAIFPFVLLPINTDIWMCSCILTSRDNGGPLNKLFILRGSLFQPPRG